MTSIIDVLVGMVKLVFVLVADFAKLCNRTWQPPDGYNATFTKPGSILRKKNNGFSLGGTYTSSIEQSFLHQLIMAASGGGKSTTCAMNSVFTLYGSGTIVALDTSKEIEKNSRGCYDIGELYRSIIVNFSDRSCNETDGWNPFPQDPADLQKFITTLVNLELGTESKDPFWALQATALLTILGKTLYKVHESYRNMTNLLHILNTLAGQPDIANRYMSVYADTETWVEFLAFNQNSDNVRASIIASAKSAMNIFTQEHIKRITSHSTYQFSDLRKHKHIVYLQTSGADLVFYKSLISLYFNALIGEIIKELPDESDENIFLILDEAGIYKIDDLPLAITQARKFRCGISLMVQNELQLYDLYSKEKASTIISNCHNKLYMSNQPLETAQRVEALSGKRQYVDEKGITRTRELITKDEIRSLDPSSAILISGHHRPAIVPLKPFYKNKEYKKYASIPLMKRERKLPEGSVPLLDLTDLGMQTVEP